MDALTKLTTMPNEIDGGLIPTLNRMGYMTTFLDPYSEKFIKYSATCKNPVLEIGAAYGIASLKALNTGARVVSNDLDPRHLQILKNKCPKEALERLTLVAGKFPEDVSFSSNYFDAILTVRVLHFLEGHTLRKFLSCCYDILAPKGRFFIVADTPYLKDWQSFIPTFEERLCTNVEWPGLIENTSNFESKRIHQIPTLMHWMDPKTLQRELKYANLAVENIGYINRTDYPLDVQLDGRESVGVVAIKL
jgi:SAM-dependent methyltransferase